MVKTLKWENISYENWLKTIDQHEQGYADLGDWEEYTDLPMDQDMDQSDYDDPEKQEERHEAYKRHIRKEFDSWHRKYKSWKYPLKLYRAVCLKSIEDLDRKNLGTDWTDEIDSAQCYGKYRQEKGDTFFVLVAEVGKDIIDWSSSFATNLNPSFGEDEQEVNLLYRKPVEIVDVLDVDEKSLGISFTGNVGKHIPNRGTNAILIATLRRIVTTAP
jgi:hypothetical protein